MRAWIRKELGLRFSLSHGVQDWVGGVHYSADFLVAMYRSVQRKRKKFMVAKKDTKDYSVLARIYEAAVDRFSVSIRLD